MKIFILFIFVLLAELAFSSEFNNAQKQYLGAENILKNPGFENGKTAWTLTSGTLATESAIKLAGSKSLKATLSSQALELYQDSSLYASQFNGSVQGLGYIRIKTQVTGLKVCARKAGVIQTSLCVDVQANNEWGLYKIPFILGGTSNGLTVTSNGASVTGDVYLDDAFVGAVDLSATQSFDTTCDTISCETTFSFFMSSSGVVSGENQNFINGNCSRFGVNNSDFSCPFISGVFSDGPNCTASVEGVQVASVAISSITTSGLSGNTVTASAYSARPVWVICHRQGADYLAAIQAQKNFQKSKVSSFSSNNADTDWQACQFSTLAWQGLGTVTNNLKCKRQGSDLLMEGNFTTGTVTSTVAEILLPIWNGVQLTSKGASVIPSTRWVGTGTVSIAASGDYAFLVGPSQSFLNVGYLSGSNPGLTATTANNFASTGTVISMAARIPIAGWESSNIIIGQFNGLESCTDSYECTDTFSAFIDGAGTVSGENVDWINGNCTLSATSLYTCLYKTGLAGNGNNLTNYMNCSAIPVDNTAVYRSLRVQTTNTSGVSIYSWASSTNAASTGAGMHLFCQKQGADYIGKTAKAVASDQNIRSIGAVGVDIQKVKFGSAANCESVCSSGTCTICNLVGSKITSVTWQSTGVYRINGLDGTKYDCSGAGVGASYAPGISATSASNSNYVYMNFGTTSGVNVGRAIVTCIGVP